MLTRENAVKARLIDRLLVEAEQDDFLIASEFVYAGGRNRADLITVGKHFVAYEVKTIRDNNWRGIDQLKIYYEFFNKTILVIDKDKYPLFDKIIDRRVGVLLFDNEAGEFNQIRQPRPRARIPKINLTYFLWRKEIEAALKMNEITFAHDDDTATLRRILANSLPYYEVHGLAVTAIHQRYDGRYQAFLKERGLVTHSDDVLMLQSPYSSIVV